MANRISSILFFITIITGTTFCQEKNNKTDFGGNNDQREFEISKSESEWKAQLTPDEFEVLRKKGTEYAFTGKFYNFKEKGIFVCAACGNELFESKTKYNSGSGWPSFYKPIDKNAIYLKADSSQGMEREEILCSKCGGHLGHVFDDGPKPTGLRYCVNSISMNFKKK